MNLSENPALKAFAGKAAILDTNLPLLDWCYKFDPSPLYSFKRLSIFEAVDVAILSSTLEVFASLATTPHILTEISNLANALPARIKDSWSAFFAGQIQLITERHLPSRAIASDPIAIRFGLTDAALAQLAATHVVFTTDWPLTGLLQKRNLPVINFNHLRDAWMDS
ncbi:MAG: hypothetical protein ACP5E2_01750 [Terracidiphilus sp.]